METRIRRTGTNHDTGMLWIFAVIFMIIDHVGVIFFPSQVAFRVIGRIALPLFAWGIAIGAEHTRDMLRYAFRLFVMMIVSQPFYMLALNHRWYELNIMATLLLGLLGIWGIKVRREWLTAAALLLSYFLKIDYGYRGVLCVLLLWAVHDSPLMLSLCFSAYCVLWGGSYSIIWQTPYFAFRLQSAAMLALPLMLIPRGERTRVPRALMYAAYPGHLLILWALARLIK